MCSAILQWEGLGSVQVRCFRIHGRRDVLIPPPAHADLLLDGGHLISMTHPKECVAYIGARVAPLVDERETVPPEPQGRNEGAARQAATQLSPPPGVGKLL
jgi:hypothetical protein